MRVHASAIINIHNITAMSSFFDSNRYLVVLKRPLLAVLLFLVLQAVSGVVMMFVHSSLDARTLSIATLACDCLVALGCLWIFRRSIYGPAEYRPSSSTWAMDFQALLGCVLGAFALDLLGELLALPNIMEEQMTAICRDPWGIAAIALAAPIAEEIMFRWGIMGHLLRKGRGVAGSILVSALFFGIIHMNPVQVFFATAMGILLGILYWKSGSLLMPCLLHVLNNSTACLMAYFLGDRVQDFSLVSAIGGESVAWCLVGVLSTLCIVMMWRYAASKAPDAQQAPSTEE